MPRTLFPAASPETRARLEEDPTLKLFNDYDWAANPLGPIPEWPESLKGAVRLMMAASIPMAMFVGTQAILIYNNAYAAFAGQRHPGIFGMPCLEAWPEIADLMRKILAIGQRGGVEVLHDLELELNRHGQPESTWVDMHVSPVLGNDGNTLGTLVTVHETTERFLARAALARSEERLSLALAGSSLVGTWDWNLHDNVVTADDQFAEMFGIEPLYAGLGVPLSRFFAAIHPDDLPGVKAEIERALAAVDEFRCECRVRTGDGDVRWIVASGLPRRDAEGRVHRFPGVAIDVSEQHHVASALAESQLRFQTLADVMPQIVWTATPDGVYDYYNARWEEFTGVADGTPDAAGWASLYHPEDRERVEAAWRHSLRTGETFQIEYRLRHRSGDYRWVLGRALAVRDATGHIMRWIGTCTDIHQSRQAAAERELVTQELSHRIKNLFAVLTGIISLSARSRPEVKSFAEELRQRVHALGEAHDFVRLSGHPGSPGLRQGSLHALVRRLLRPYEQDGATRLVFEGEDVTMDDGAATPLALLFHELGTNAAKYGAFSTPQGQVTLTGRLEGEHYHLTWKERGGPGVADSPALNGFGSRVITLSIEGQLRGRLHRQWDPDGLRVDVELPLAALRRSARLREDPVGA